MLISISQHTLQRSPAAVVTVVSAVQWCRPKNWHKEEVGVDGWVKNVDSPQEKLHLITTMLQTCCNINFFSYSETSLMIICNPTPVLRRKINGLFRGKTNINVIILWSIRLFCLLLAKLHHPCVVYHLSSLGSGFNHLMTSTGFGIYMGWMTWTLSQST